MVRIFLRAVCSKLGPAREIAARVLRALGDEVVIQTEFPTSAGVLKATYARAVAELLLPRAWPSEFL
jgi:hypothetical protein